MNELGRLIPVACLSACLAMTGLSFCVAADPTDLSGSFDEEASVFRQVSYGFESAGGRSGSTEFGNATDRLMRFRAGFTQVNKSIESHVGGTWGLDGVVPVDDECGVHWAGRVNQFSGGTQYLGSLGAYERSRSAGDLQDRFGVSAIVDLFHDSRVSDLWLTQIRGQAGFRMSDTSAVGVHFTAPLNDNRSNQIPAPGSIIWPNTAVDSIGAYVTEELMQCQLQASLGYREKPNSTYVDFSVRRPLAGDNVFAYASTNYIAERGQFGTWVGVEYRLGRREVDCGCECFRREVWDDPVIYNTFNYGENSFWHNTDNPARALPLPSPE